MLGDRPDSKSVVESAAAFGIEVEVEEDVLEIWPDNWIPVHVFAKMTTQWNVGMRGPVGLRYEVLETVMRLINVPRGERLSVFEAIRIMENEALRLFSEQRER